jgi:hypothetical protein
VLQIISGKFFDSDDRFRHDAKGILFSNYSWVQPIETCVAILEPVDTYASVSSYVVSYVNQIEKEKPPAKNVLVRTGDSEIIEQFMLLCCFSLKAFFHQDRNSVAVACRDRRINSSDYHIPSNFVPRIFSRQINGSVSEVESLSGFIDSVIGLKREYYNSLIISLRSFTDALQIIGSNIDLAYSLLVYSLEALAQRSDTYVPAWKDYPNEVRENLDKILCGIADDTAKDIRNTLLKNSNLKATKRFLDFVHSHIDEQFFVDEAPPGFITVRSSELVRALRNAYTIRSKFAHQLQPIQEQLKHPKMADGDVIRFSDEPYLSISGLVRIVQHVIGNFVKKKGKVTHEAFNWRSELPGIVMMELAPQYWIWQHKELRPEYATKKLSGFLSQLETVILNSELITDLRELLSEYEKLIDQSASPYKTQMLVTYALYNAFVADEHKCVNYPKVFEKNKKLFDHCTIETMVTWLLLDQRWPWTPEICASCWQDYQRAKYRKSSITVPPVMGVAVTVEIASMYKQENNTSEYNSWMGIAILEAAGQKETQKRLIEAKSGLVQVTGMEVMNGAASKKA